MVTCSQCGTRWKIAWLMRKYPTSTTCCPRCGGRLKQQSEADKALLNPSADQLADFRNALRNGQEVII